MIEYKNYEIFIDPCYFDMFCVRNKGCKDFKKTIHVSTEKEAKQVVDEIVILKEYMEWQAGDSTSDSILNELLIYKFVTGKKP